MAFCLFPIFPYASQKSSNQSFSLVFIGVLFGELSCRGSMHGGAGVDCMVVQVDNASSCRGASWCRGAPACILLIAVYVFVDHF